MVKKTSILVLLFVLGSASLLHAQSTPPPNSNDDGFYDYVDWAWEGNFKPFLEANVGIVRPMHQKFSLDFSDMGMAEAKIGYSEVEKYKSFVKSLDDRYLFGGYASQDLGDWDAQPDSVTTKYTRFGFGNRLGYGYKIGPFDLLIYNQNAFVWTNLEFGRPSDLSQDDIDILNRYEGSYRFGQLAEGGLKFRAFKSLSVIGGYELAVVFPRHVFWEWAGSAMLQYSLSGAITTFAEEIVNSSPLLGPLFYFVLKNGLSYAFYVAMKDDMNWPFNSETPLTMETLKLGAAITF